MLANYHTHTYLCKHANGNMEEYVTSAIKSGLKILGFSDHAPIKYSTGYQSYFKMAPKELGLYVTEVLRLKEKYKNDIKILLGYEAEYYPLEFKNMMDVISEFPYDYLILGQHYTQNEYDGFYPGFLTEDEEILKDYVNQLICGIETGMFTYIAHPDLINYAGDEKIYTQELQRLCRAAKKANMPLEYNILGLRQNRNYPNSLFWEIAAKEGNTVIIGSDAHTSGDVFDKENVERAKGEIKRLGLKRVKDNILENIESCREENDTRR